MRHLKAIFIFIAALLLIQTSAKAQEATTQGTEFWVSYMTNGHKYISNAPNNGNWILTQLLISAKRNCSGTITNPQTGWSTSFTVNANNITTVDIPETHGYVDGTSESVVNKGLKVVTDDTVSVFCTNIAHLSFDASYVLPIQSLADEYIIQTYDQSHSAGSPVQTQNQTSAFLIVATENNTTVDITVTEETMGGHHGTFTTTLNEGQVYQVRSNNADNNRDLSGSRVKARDGKRIAVFNGNNLTAVPTNGSSFDHIFEQAMPLQSWGKKFVVTSSLEREKDYVKVTSASDNNVIRKNGTAIATLSINESIVFELQNNEKSCFIDCTGPAAVYLYNTTRGGNSIGDPSVVWIAPIEQRIDEITFSTFNNENINISTHHVNIIVNRSDIGTVELDGNLIPVSQFEDVNGSDEYAFTRQNINHGVHHLQCFGGFNAHVYGFGVAKGYAYLVGSKAIDLSTRVNMNGTFVPKEGTYEYCPNEPITFEAEVNLENASLLWDFGDGTTSTQNPVSHTFAEKRVYEVVLTATAKGQKSSDVSHYYVDTRIKTFTEEVELCKGSVYAEHGLNIVITGDTIIGAEIDNAVHPVCKDSLFVYVTALPGFYASYEDARCWRGYPELYEGHGFSFIYDHPGVYDEQISEPTPEGCDSIVDLHLVVADRIINPDTIVQSVCSDSYTWNGVTYYEDGIYDQTFPSMAGCDSIVTLKLSLSELIEGGTDVLTGTCAGLVWHGTLYNTPGEYTDTIPSSMGCDSIVHLVLTMPTPPKPTDIFPLDSTNTAPHWVISSTEFDIHYYDYTLEDSLVGAEWDSVVWFWETPCQWILEPFGENSRCCRVTVLNRVEDTVWLRARVHNPCDESDRIERRYWFVCSFYGIDDIGPSTNSDALPIDIMPNPTNGEMTLRFGDWKGRVVAKVYNTTSQLVDQFALDVSPNGEHHYSLSNCRSGIYIIVFDYGNGIVTRKVSLIK